MMLYRPFLHYVSQSKGMQNIDRRSYALAANCVSVSRNIVHISHEMNKRGILSGAYWFSMYTTFFAILSLVYYALENPNNQASQEVLKVATQGRDTLQAVSSKSMAADRCSATLKVSCLLSAKSKLKFLDSLQAARSSTTQSPQLDTNPKTSSTKPSNHQS